MAYPAQELLCRISPFFSIKEIIMKQLVNFFEVSVGFLARTIVKMIIG